jgi:large subunit ribosomal protein L3
MKKAIIGRKVGMTQIFTEEGKVIPVTVIEAGPCTVIQKKIAEKDGYNAVQLGFEDVPARKLSKPELGHLKTAGEDIKKYLKEFKLEDCTPYNAGDVLLADVFAEGDYVDVTGISKGKGYAGVVKRWGQHVQNHTHGVGPVHRSVGSTGANSDPARVMPGKKMPGHMGTEQVTVQNLRVAKVDPDLNLIAICGAIPGPRGGIVYIKDTVKNHKVKNTQAKSASVNPQKASARR